MKWYADAGTLRTRQLLTDAAVVLWVLLWIRVGAAVHDAVRKRAAPGRELEEAGDGLAGGLGRAAERDDVELFALRAAAHRPLHELARLGADPVGRWRRGEPGAAEALAALELHAQGLTP